MVQPDRRMVLAALALAPAAAALAQPELPRTITLAVGASPGGTTDTLAREVAEVMQEKLGRPVVVENRTGAGGSIAASQVAHAAPDGGTLLVAFTSHTLNAALLRQLPYRPIEDFTPISLLARLSASVLVVGPSVQEPDLAAFLAAARAQPDRFSFAIGGVGSSLHMQTVMFRLALGLGGPEVPFRGTSPALVDVVAGNVDAMFVPLDVGGELMRSGKVRPLAVTSPKPLEALPGIPPLRSLAPDVRSAVAWFGILGPAGMPAPVVATLHDAIAVAQMAPRAVARITAAGGESEVISPEAFRAFLIADMAQWQEIARAGKIEKQ